MNILIITSLYPGYEGEPNSDIPYVIHYFAKEWQKNNINVRVINTRMVYPKIFNITSKGKYRNRFDKTYTYQNEEIKITRVPIVQYPRMNHSKSSIKKSTEYVLKILKDEKFNTDIILTHMISPGTLLGARLKKELNVPLVSTLHIGDIGYLDNIFWKKEFYEIEKYIDAYGFRSEVIRKRFIDKHSVIVNDKPNFIATSGISEKSIINKDELAKKIEKKTYEILVVSTFIKRKNIDSILYAINELKGKYEFKLTIIGTGPEKENLIKIVEELELSKYVEFLGQQKREDILKYMRNADIFALISKNETLGMVYLEAMASGCIVIGSKNEGIDGIITSGKNGYLCNAGEYKELSNLIEQILLSSKEEKKKVLMNSYEKIKYQTEEKVSMEYLAFLNKIVKGEKNYELK